MDFLLYGFFFVILPKILKIQLSQTLVEGYKEIWVIYIKNYTK